MTVRHLLHPILVGMLAAACGFNPVPGDAWGIDPDAANVVPRTGNDAASVVTSAAADSRPPGVEGSVLFIRLTAPDGTIVLDRPFDWPSDAQNVPPGDYALTAYWRACGGNCSNLDPESEFCAHNVSLGAGSRVVVDIVPRELAPGSQCAVVVAEAGDGSKVASCAPAAFAQFPPDFPAALPPPVCIHGVAGLPASWCWEGCVDGGPRGPEGLPVAVAPFEVTLPEGSRITSASAFLPDAPDAHHYLEIESGTALRGLPPRADMISVTVFWSEGGDASYYWAVGTP